ncbi:hypothetical protein CEP54_015403 [Fusarium duplospermum]|uniref:Azaphilone pigments biosynthesis cluster protein L N-terminal domain-containing protein n=1 Tax=Fusarium duplospermum TaxID=1325734 RepID=A0A428NPE3_9HYPO|nr:hypothetical protein CEP54_015403 [Fusarium duplospermum]
MADPLSVTASVVGIVAAAVQGVQLLSNTIDKIRNAPEAVRSIQDEIQQLKPTLTQLESAINEGRPGLILGSETNQALKNCHRFSESLNHWMRRSIDNKMSMIDSAKIGIFRQDQIRTLKEQLNGFSEWLDKRLTGANEDREALVLYEAEALASSDVEDKQDLIHELGQQRAMINAYQGICEKALKTVVFERTGQIIRDVKVTDNSVVLTGFVNAEGEEMRIEQGISQIAADGRSIAVAGVVNNVDFVALYSQMQQPK